MMPSLTFVLLLSAALFCIGLVLVISKRNVIVMLMGIELIFNAANLNLVAFSQYDAHRLQGQALSLMVMVVAAAEAAIALAIIRQLYQHYQTPNPDEMR